MSTQPDTKIISKLAEILDKNNLTELEFESENCRICLTREIHAAPAVYSQAAPIMSAAPVAPASVPQAVAVAPVSAAEVDYSKHEGAIKSPMVGVVYMSAEPGAANYISVGSDVKVGDTLCLIEAMKTFNPVKATKAGKVSKILVETGNPVEYGEPLVIIE